MNIRFKALSVHLLTATGSVLSMLAMLAAVDGKWSLMFVWLLLALVVDGVDASIEIRGPEVTRAVSIVAANPEVRSELVRRQREWAAQRGGGVLEGRDIGSVVFPDAALKVYLTAAPEVRAARRSQEVTDLSYETVAADLLAAQQRELGCGQLVFSGIRYDI